MWLVYFLLIVSVLVLIDWGTYKIWPGNKDRNGEINVSDQFTIFAGLHHWSFHFEPDYDEGDHMQLIAATRWHQFFIHIPFWKVPEGADRWEDNYRFGFYLYSDSSKQLFFQIYLMWRDKSKCIRMPWEYECHHTIIEGKNGRRFVEFYGDYRKRRKRAEKYNCKPLPVKDTYDIYRDPNFYWEAPYEYTLKNGETQKTTAHYYIEEREFRPIGTKFLPIFKHIRRDISIELMDEMGERVGTWKGGVTGFGRVINPGEDPHTAYQRIMKETKLD